EDGIRDDLVTGVQTCALPISFKTWMLRLTRWRIIDQLRKRLPVDRRTEITDQNDATAITALDNLTSGHAPDLEMIWSDEWQRMRSEERRVGKGVKYRRVTYRD